MENISNDTDLTVLDIFFCHYSCREATNFSYILAFNAVRSLSVILLRQSLKSKNKGQLNGQNHLKFEGKLGSKAVKPNCLDP